MLVRRLLTAALIAAGLLSYAAVAQAASKNPVSTGTFSNLAASGYDPVAYFTQDKPVEGRSDLEYEWNDATWRFSSAENLAAFKASPEAYAPQYGGYCAWAVSQGYTAKSDPDAWRIVNGKLYLNYSKGIQKRWAQDIPGNIAAADANWPKVLE
jgi:YHS domain-containing protein